MKKRTRTRARLRTIFCLVLTVIWLCAGPILGAVYLRSAMHPALGALLGCVAAPVGGLVLIALLAFVGKMAR